MSGATLKGRRVLVTAERRIGAKLARRLAELGAEPVELPCIRIEPPADPDRLRHSVARLDQHDWLVITSRNGVDAFFAALRDLGGPPNAVDTQVAAVGPATARRLRAGGIPVTLVPDQATSQALLEALVPCVRPSRARTGGASILLLQGDAADGHLAQGLQDAGAAVQQVVAYRTVEGIADPEHAVRTVAGPPPIAAVTLMSGSAARALAAALGPSGFARLPLVCIGPATAAVVQELGARPARVATPHTIDGLVDAVVAELS